ncbi:TVP38/TMEM64 family protein [Paenibacillus wulumuqiensis]|uniref:TVP38/TMEM64 family protein n=1 Tax=Paenibacillus wulumuqiensis TaxID=1567107 RepID=UPI000619E147|nr:VTT domain-containing protein [Paenibacillus wulumuqiensis]
MRKLPSRLRYRLFSSAWTSKIIVAAIYVILLVIIMAYRVPLQDKLESIQQHPSLFLLFIIGLLVGFFPIVPYGIVSGLFGFLYGWFAGGLLSLLCSTLASLLMYGVVRVTMSPVSPESKRSAHPFMQQLQRHAFVAIVFARMLPIVPSQLINITCSMARISWKTFLLATMIGKLPVMFLFSSVGSQFMSNPKRTLLIVGVYLLLMIILYRLYVKYRSSRNLD